MYLDILFCVCVYAHNKRKRMKSEDVWIAFMREQTMLGSNPLEILFIASFALDLRISIFDRRSWPNQAFQMPFHSMLSQLVLYVHLS